MSSGNSFKAKSRFQLHHPTTTARRAANEQRGFTLTELAAVLAGLALLALVALPAFAGARNKGARALCGENLRQMFVASLVYAESFNTKLPPWRAGQAGQDDMWEGQYSRFVYVGSTAVYLARSFSQAPGASLNNMGYLYGANLVGDGNIFYCPALSPGNAYDGSRYSPLLTSDSGGMVRSSYSYNPRMVNWDPRWTVPVNTQRRYLKTTQFEPHKVFGLDLVSGLIAHRPEQGYNVVFTDGSVKFCSVASGAAASLAKSGYSNGNYAAREQLFDLFEGM